MGKTLALLGPQLPTGPLARSLELLGLALYGKCHQAKQRLQQWTQQSSDPVLIKQAVSEANHWLLSLFFITFDALETSSDQQMTGVLFG